MPGSADLTPLTFDAHGHLVDASLWSPDIAKALAEQEKIALTSEHLQISLLLRSFYAETEVVPEMRPFVKLVRERLAMEKGDSIYLMGLFGGSPAKTAARIAGLPKPTNCL